VTLGTTMLVALLSISATADSRIVSQLSKGGPAAAIHVDDAYPDPSNLASDELKTGPHHDLNDAAVAALRSSPHVASVVTVLSTPVLAIPCPGVAPGPKAAAACRLETDGYITVADINATLAKAESLGGKTVVPRFSPDGNSHLALVADPEGNVLGLTEL